MYHKRKAISRELYDYCIQNGHADQNLIAKWKKVCCCFVFPCLSIMSYQNDTKQKTIISPVTKNYAVFAASSPKIQILEQLASVGYREPSWRKTR